MRINLLAKSILLVLVAVSTGCVNDENSENILSESEQLLLIRKAIANAPEQKFEKEDLPVWLSEFIDSLYPDDIRDVAVYQAKWKGEDIYYVYDSYASCIMCSTFKSDGDQFDWSKIDLKEFWRSATDWKCICMCRSKIHDVFYACGIGENQTRSTADVETFLFSEEDIVSFNVTTREIKFKDMEPPLYKRLEPFHEIEFHLGDDTLFTVSSFVGLWDSRIFEDLVLCYGNQESLIFDGYYLYDCYPLFWLTDTETLKANREKNKSQWETFIHYLDSKGKLSI